MKPLRVRDALCSNRKVVFVDSETRPKPNRQIKTIYAVFEGYGAGRTDAFLGLVTEKDIAQFPQRIFGDLVNRHAPPPVRQDTPLSQLQHRVDTEEVFLFSVVDRHGRFVGVLTLDGMLLALLKREKTMLAESARTNSLLKKERAQLTAWTARLSELQQASRTLMGLLSHTSLHTELLQVGIEALVKLLNARYGAIGILEGGRKGVLRQFVHTGMTPAQVAKMEHFPQGKGLLGTVVGENIALRLDDLRADPRSGGFPPNHPPMQSLLAVPISHQGPIHGRIYVCDKRDGTPFSSEDESLALSFAHSLSLMLDNAREIEEIRQAKQRLDYMAHYDGLTGLPNRTLFSNQLRQAIFHARRSGTMIGVLFLDIDNFKLINDTLGHSSGDLLLQHIAVRLKSCLREDDIIARQGGDEFTLLLSGLDTVPSAAMVAQKVLDTLVRPMLIGEHETAVSASIGIALYPADGSNLDELLKNADTAMYHAKARGRNNFQFFSEGMNEQAQRRLMLEQHLRRALDLDEMSLCYQPQVNVKSGRTVGVEALLRWDCAQLGSISPEQFIPVAEETGLILPIGDWALHTACAQAKAWQDLGLSLPRIAVNISARQFMQKDFHLRVKHVLGVTGLPPECLELEITESVLMHCTEAVSSLLNNLRSLGVHLSIDDFGTGYSSLNYLKRFPIGTLKIDKSFVRDIATDNGDAAIVTAIIALADSLQLNTVAEGVETEAQLRFLQERRCQTAQGYLTGKPMPSADIEHMLASEAEEPLHAQPEYG